MESVASGCHLCSIVFWDENSTGLFVSSRPRALQPEHACVWAKYLWVEDHCTKSDFELLCGYKTFGTESDTTPQDLPRGRQDSRFTLSLAWLRIVRGYQRTEFTYESDRLIALSGVAKAIEHSKGFTYVAGTWKELWPLDLLWWYHGWDPSKEEPTDFTKSKPPSWSWAARKWGKDFLLLERFDFDIPLITYRAQFKYFTCPTSTDRYTGTRADKEGIILTIKSRVKRGLAAWKWRFKCWLLAVRASDTEWVYVYWDPGQEPRLGESVLLLILISMESENTNKKDPYQIGLVLMLEEGVKKKNGQPCYRRVGYFNEGGFGNHETWGEETICLC
ncbi:uncharacterized protein B0T23DRAFT_411294 [Neurospora hispaniola]|uniref:Heterokaryon incompatibility domain-containing protein n=1 Tax=Neurospora hispaniola TaxID=588809 RepID=A0AAJ0MUH5_9PEZI|nr:hypothetical protein B0T23DRAFT_411294 [Neurospora hispaniola]